MAKIASEYFSSGFSFTRCRNWIVRNRSSPERRWREELGAENQKVLPFVFENREKRNKKTK